MMLSPAQYHTLHFLTAGPRPGSKLHPATIRVLLDRGLITERYWQIFAITDAGRAVIGVLV